MIHASVVKYLWTSYTFNGQPAGRTVSSGQTVELPTILPECVCTAGVMLVFGDDDEQGITIDRISYDMETGAVKLHAPEDAGMVSYGRNDIDPVRHDERLIQDMLDRKVAEKVAEYVSRGWDVDERE